jgi:hypothetical protein
MSIAKITGAGSLTNKPVKNDVYHTPTVCTEALTKVEAGYWPKTIWEPCAGRGDLSSVLKDKKFTVIETDLAQRVDFLKTTEARASAIVTNPPYRYATESRAQAWRHVPCLAVEGGFFQCPTRPATD